MGEVCNEEGKLGRHRRRAQVFSLLEVILVEEVPLPKSDFPHKPSPVRHKILCVCSVWRVADIFEPPELIFCTRPFAGSNTLACLVHAHFSFEVYVFETFLDELCSIAVADCTAYGHHIDFES